MRESDYADLVDDFSNLNLTSSSNELPIITPAMNRYRRYNGEVLPTEPGFIVHSDGIFNLIMNRLRESLSFISPDALYIWRESNLQTALTVLVSSRYFENEIRSTFTSGGTADTEASKDQIYDDISVTVSEEDPVWVDNSDGAANYNPDNNYERNYNPNGQYVYNDVTIYVSSKSTKELIIIQCELKYINMNYMFKNTNGNPFSDESLIKNKFKLEKVAPLKFMEFLDRKETTITSESIPIMAFIPPPGGGSAKPGITTLGEMFNINRNQSMIQLTGKRDVTRWEMNKTPGIRRAKVVNFMIVGYANRVISQKMGEYTLN